MIALTGKQSETASSLGQSILLFTVVFYGNVNIYVGKGVEEYDKYDNGRKGGDCLRDTVQLLIDTVGDDVYHFCCRLTRNRMDADDLYQDTFLKALEQQRRLEPVCDREQKEAIRRNRNFLMGIAANLWKNQWRKKKKEQRHLSIEDTEFFELPSSDDEDMQIRLERKEIQQRLTMHIRTLPEKLKMVLYLFYAAEMQTEEIADTLHIPQGTVKSRLYLARVKLKDSLEADGYEI